jgi:hypothetical protein
MNTRSLIAIALIVIGIIAFAYQGITYTTSEDAIDIGPLKVTTQETHTIPIPPIVGGIALVGGILLLTIRAKSA